MKTTRLLMGMPITVEILDAGVTESSLDRVYEYLTNIDERFSTYKTTSEISAINAGTLTKDQWSVEMQEVLAACEQTKQETNGFFNIAHNDQLDPSGYVKGWAIQNAANLLRSLGFRNYFVDAGGDIQTAGVNAENKPWVVGIRNPLQPSEIVKRVALTDQGMATSGTYIRGQHIYNPHQPEETLTEVVSLTVISECIVDADRFATAAFAMGRAGVEFIASLDGFEAYQIDHKGIAIFTPGFTHYVLS